MESFFEVGECRRVVWREKEGGSAGDERGVGREWSCSPLVDLRLLRTSCRVLPSAPTEFLSGLVEWAKRERGVRGRPVVLLALVREGSGER
jgi:hypothetical protein